MNILRIIWDALHSTKRLFVAAIGYDLVPSGIAKVLKAQGLDNPDLFNGLGIAAALASLQDSNYVAGVARKVAEERELWISAIERKRGCVIPGPATLTRTSPG